MHPNFHQFLYDFFIAGMDLDYIASKYESSWYEVAEVLDTEPARRHMQTAIRVEQLRDVAQNIANRRFAISTLEDVIQNRGQTAVGHEGRRRAADAILRATKASTASSRSPARAATHPKPTSPVTQPPSPSPQPENQTAPTRREPARQPDPQSAQPGPTTRAPTTPIAESQPTRSRQTAHSPIDAPPRATSAFQNSS